MYYINSLLTLTFEIGIRPQKLLLQNPLGYCHGVKCMWMGYNPKYPVQFQPVP